MRSTLIIIVRIIISGIISDIKSLIEHNSNIELRCLFLKHSD